MTRKNLISLMVLDLIVMALAIALMAYRYQAFSSLPISSLKQNTKQLSDEPEAAPQAMRKQRKPILKNQPKNLILKQHAKKKLYSCHG